MKKLAILALALELIVCGCGTSPNTNPIINTATSGNWEAQLSSAQGGQGSLLNFVITFSVTNSGPLDITGFGFFNQGDCFATGANVETYNGSASFTTTPGTNQVVGQLTITVTSTTTGSVLVLTAPQGGLTGISNGSITTTGTLSDGVAVGTWSLTPGVGGGSNSACTGSGTFIMCQGTTTCTPTGALDPGRMPYFTRPKSTSLAG